MRYLFSAHRLIIVLIISLSLCFCTKDNFPQNYDDLVGDWTIRNISGGFTGGGYAANFDILSIDHFKRFYILRNDTLLSQGTVEVTGQTSQRLVMKFNSVNGFFHSLGGEMSVTLRQDTLILSDNCSDCYSYLFVRNQVFDNEKYIQPKKRLSNLQVTTYPIGFKNYLTSLCFQNENMGFITSIDGSILKTSDGGKNWKIVPTNNSLPLTDIAFVDEKRGFAVGGEGSCGGTGCKVPGYIMLKTIDSGETWEKVDLPYKPAEFTSIQFYNPNFGIAFGPGAMLKTTDGGLNWTSFSATNMKAVFKMFILNDNTAFLAGIKGQLFKTTDGALTWSNLAVNTNNYINSITFIDEKRGFVGLWNALMKTNDGGVTWSAMTDAPLGVTTMVFNSETNGVAFGSRTYASSRWDVWDAYFNVLVNGKWYGDERVTYHVTPFSLDSKHFFTITSDNQISIITLL